eukprot:snap_masked-scaffold_37-processed-gene-1.35-mRNA-1 protein AED:1.00 eAED:1.00 QI:0/-1/0/0/-1/1/1/0/60
MKDLIALQSFGYIILKPRGLERGLRVYSENRNLGKLREESIEVSGLLNIDSNLNNNGALL